MSPKVMMMVYAVLIFFCILILLSMYPLHIVVKYSWVFIAMQVAILIGLGYIMRLQMMGKVGGGGIFGSCKSDSDLINFDPDSPEGINKYPNYNSLPNPIIKLLEKIMYGNTGKNWARYGIIKLDADNRAGIIRQYTNYRRCIGKPMEGDPIIATSEKYKNMTVEELKQEMEKLNNDINASDHNYGFKRGISTVNNNLNIAKQILSEKTSG